jgi:hypothetical protein
MSLVVASLLNPCRCKSVWKCKCRMLSASGSISQSNLDTLANAAGMCCGRASASSSVDLGALTERQYFGQGSPSIPSNKRPKHSRNDSVTAPGPELPPIYLDTAVSTPVELTFPTMPPMSTITSIAGSGCTCGVHCGCPGCVEHRGAEYASKDRRDCADGCGTCVDHQSGVALSNSESGTNFLDKFFARAATLPAPPVNRKMGFGMDLDPMNVMVYPDAARDAGERGVAFGLVNIPKLECCGGRCGCPDGTCGCGKSCQGRCADHVGKEQVMPLHLVTTPSVQRTSIAAGSCCAGKKLAVT